MEADGHGADQERTRHRAIETAAIAVVLAAATLLVYWQVRHFDFLNFDDNVYVPGNPHIRGGLTWAGIVWAFSTFDYFYWQPLTWLSHMLDCQWFGLNAGYHHFTNVVLHVVNSLLVFAVFRRLTGAHWRSALLAGLFALHPLRVESVAWVAERKDVLSCLWFLLAVWAYVRYTERPSDGRYRCVLLAMLAGLMAKPMLVTVPLLFLVLDYWPLRRVALAEKAPMVFLAAVASGLTFIGTHRMGAMAWSAAIPLQVRISNALLSYVRYIGKTIWPAQLSIFYSYPDPISISGWKVAAAALLLAGITAATLWAGRRERFFAAGWLWFLVGLIPTIGIVQVGRQAMADRFTYIPLIGLFLVAVWGGELLLRKYRAAAAAGVAILLMACGLQSWKQTRTWRDSVTVFEHALAIEESSVAHRHLGAALAQRDLVDESIPHFAAAIRIEPGWFIAHYDYGLALKKRGDLEGAAAQFAEAARWKPNYGDALLELGQILVITGKSREARRSLREALRVGVSPDKSARAGELLAEISSASND